MVYLLRREILNHKQLMTHNFKDDQIDRIIEMAWEDRTPFDAIELQFGLKENDVRKIMRTSLKESSFKMWRKRVTGRKTKHIQKSESTRFKSKNQVLAPELGSRFFRNFVKMLWLLWAPWRGPVALGSSGGNLC